jgi:transcriptional regulator with XRE-family HTH domain
MPPAKAPPLRRRSDVGLQLRLARAIPDWTQGKTARRAEVSKSQLSSYERQKQTPPEETLERIAAALGVSLALLDQLLPVFRRLADRMTGDEVEAVAAHNAAARAAGHATDALALILGERLAALAEEETPPAPPDDPETVAELAELLAAEPPRLARLRIAAASRYWSDALCSHLCAESEKAAAEDPARARHLAELAGEIAREIPGTAAERAHREARTLACRAHAARAGGDLSGADALNRLARERGAAGIKASKSPPRG